MYEGVICVRVSIVVCVRGLLVSLCGICISSSGDLSDLYDLLLHPQ